MLYSFISCSPHPFLYVVWPTHWSYPIFSFLFIISLFTLFYPCYRYCRPIFTLVNVFWSMLSFLCYSSYYIKSTLLHLLYMHMCVSNPIQPNRYCNLFMVCIPLYSIHSIRDLRSVHTWTRLNPHWSHTSIKVWDQCGVDHRFILIASALWNRVVLTMNKLCHLFTC